MGKSKTIGDKTYIQDEGGNWYEGESPVQKEPLTAKVINGVQYHKDEAGNWYEGETILKKNDGQPLETGGQKQPASTSPTPSPLQSKLPEAKKVGGVGSQFNPASVVKEAQQKKEAQPFQFSKDAEPVNVDAIRNYEGAQQIYSTVDKQKASILNANKHSIFSPIPLIEDVAGAIFPGYAKEQKYKTAMEIGQADIELQSAKKKAFAAQDAIKNEIPKVLKPMSDNWAQYVNTTVDNVPKLDEFKIAAFAKKVAAQYGVPETGMFYSAIKREANNLITQNLIKPELEKTLAIKYKQQTGRDLSVDMKSESNQAALKLEELKKGAVSKQKNIQNEIFNGARGEVAAMSSDITTQVNALNDEIKVAADAITNKYSTLIKDNKFIGSQEEFAQYQQDFATIQQKENENKKAFESINKSYLDAQNLIYTKANSRYNREAQEVAKITQAEYEKFKPKANPKMQATIEKLYGESYNEVLDKNQVLRQQSAAKNSIFDNLKYNILSSLGGQIKGWGEGANLANMATFGEYLQNSFAQDVPDFKSAKDYLDLQKDAKWAGQIIGGILPGMAAAAAVTAATGGGAAPIGFQMVSQGLAQWATETYASAGNMKADVYAATGDIAAAQNAERQTIEFQKDILPLYAFSGLPFIGKPISKMISKAVPSAVRAASPTISRLAKFAENKWVAPIIGGTLETVEELPQEYSQNLSEEAIRKEGNYKNMFDYHTKEKLENTALNIAPMFLFGAAGEVFGQSDETKKQYAVEQAAKAFALKTNFAELAPGQKEQFLFDVIQRQGAPFAAAYLTSAYGSGQMDKATFEGMQQTYAKQVELLGKTEELGLTPVQAKLFNAFSTYHENEKERFNNETDPILKTIAAARMTEYETALTNISLKKEPDYSVVTYPDNTQMVFMHSELENSLNYPAFAQAVANGDIKVAVFGQSEKLNKKIEDTTVAVVAAQKEEKKLAKQQEVATKKEIAATFNVEIEDNVGDVGVEVRGLGTEEQTQQAKQALRDAGIKIRQDDTEDISGLPSKVGGGQELVQVESQQGAGTEAAGAGGVLQAQGVGGQVQGVGQKILAPVSVSNKTELSGLEERTSSDKEKSGVLSSAKKAIETLKSVFPDMEIFIHEDAGSYNQTMLQTDGVENSRGNFAFERDENDVPTGAGRIDINLSNASETTVAHEVTHAVLLKAFGDSPATFKQFRDRISSILRADLNKELLAFENMYKGKAVAPEEYLTQLSALLSKSAETVEYKPSTLRKIAAVINEFVAKITGGKLQPFKGEVDFKNFVDFLNQMAQAIEKGEAIQGVTEKINTSAEPNKTEVDTSSLKSKSSLIQDLGLQRIVGMNKRITENVTIKDIGDVKSHLTFSDRLVTGKVGNKNYLGGILFAAATNRVWASFTKTKVSQIISGMPKNEDGYRYLMPALLTEGAHMSNKNMSNTAIKLIEDAISKGEISPIDADLRIRKALNRKGLEAFLILYSDTIGKNNLTSELVISAIDNAIVKSNSSFEDRNTFLESLLGKADIDLKKRFGGLPSYGVLANGLAEPITNGHDFGDILLVIRTKGDLIAVQSKEGDSDYHESYPLVIRAVNPDGSIADVETLIFKNSYNAVDVFPEVTNKQGQKLTYKQYVDKYGDGAKSRYLGYMGARSTMSTSVTEKIITEAKAKSNVDKGKGFKPKPAESELPEQKIKSKSQLEKEKGLPLIDETKKYEQQPKSTEYAQGGKGISKSITTGKKGVGKERPYNAESYSNPDGTPQYVVKRSDRDGGKRLDISVNGTPSKAKAVYTQSEQLKSAINNYRNAYTDKNLIELDDANLFHKLISKAKKTNEFGASVHVYEPVEYAQMRLFITPDGKAGVALKPDGDLVSGFSNQEEDKPRRIAQLLGLAIKEGAIKADSFDTVLPQYYLDFGLIPVAQDKWNEQFKPEKWDKKVFKRWNNGEPDVIYYVYKGGDRATISKRAGEFGSWKDLKKDVPYAEYDDAVKIQEQNIKSKAQLPEQIEATAKALKDVGEEAKDTIKYNYEDSFKFNDFDWNEESKRENFREWLSDFEKKQFNKNLPKVIKEVKEDIALLKEKELSNAKLKDFEELIIPTLGNSVLVPILSEFEASVLFDPNATVESIEKGFREAKNIIDEDGSLNMSKINSSKLSDLLNEDRGISLPAFKDFVEKNPDYKGVFDAWKKVLDKNIELTLKETNAFRSPSIKELENLYKELTKLKGTSEAPTTVTSKSQLPQQKGVGEAKTTMVSKSQKAKVDFGVGEEGKDNKKEFDKLTSTIPNSGEVTKYLSGETIEKYEGEKPRNEQEVLAQQLKPALERGVDIIEKAKELFGEKYIETLLQYVETENLPPANKALIYVSLENEVAKQKIENPSEAAKISKMQDLVRAKSQAFLRSNSLAINMGRLRKFAEVGYDVNKLTDRFFSSREMEDKKKIEEALQTTADDINKEAERIITDEENIKAKVDEGVKEEIQKIYENLSTEKKKTVDKRLSVLDKMKQKIFNKYTFKSKKELSEKSFKSKSSVNDIIEEGYNKIFNAMKAGVEINKAINIGVDKIKEEIEKTTGQKWADEAEFKKDMIEAFKAEGLIESKTKEKSQEQILQEQQRKLEAEINRQLSIVLKLQEKLARYESGDLEETDVREQLKDVPEIEELKQKVKEAQSNYNKKIAEEKRVADNIEKLEKELERVKGRIEKTPKEKTSEVKQLSEEEEALVAKIKEANEAWTKEKESASKLEKQYRALETERNRQLERVSILKEKLEALKRGEKPKKNAQEVRLDTPEIEALKADIKKEERRLAEAEAKKEKTIAERLEEAKARVMKQIESIKEQIANKQRVQKRDKLKPDAALENLMKQRDALSSLLDKYVPKVDAYADERNAKAAKTKLENEIIELNRQIQKGQKDKIEKKESKESAELDNLRAEKEARQSILEALDPTPKLFIENTLIEQGFGRQINVKTKDGVEKRWVLDWKKLAGEEGSVDNIRERVESALIDKGFSDEQILRMQDAFVEEYNNLSESIVEKALNEINARNKQATTPEQKSAVRKLVEMYNYGLFNEDPSAYETALAKTVGITGLSLENFERVRELGEVLSNLFNSNFEGKPLNESQLRTAIQIIEEKMRTILNSEAMQQGGNAFRLSEIVKGYFDASQRMMLNTVKQGIENPISGLLERFYSSIGYAGTIPEQLNAQQRKMARDIYKEMVLQKGMGYGNVGNAFISKGSLDAYVHNMSDSQLVQGIMSVAMGKTILDAVDSAYKAKITQQKFTYNLISILTRDRMVNGKLEKGMSKEEAKRYVAEKISGQSFEDAQDTAFDIIDKINTQAGKKIFNDSPEFISRLATDIVNAALVNGEKITAEMVTAAYNAAYKAAGRGLGHVANNFVSEQINTRSGKLESDISEAIKQKNFPRAAYLNYFSIFYRNIANPFVGGGSNWVILKAEKTGIGLISGFASMIKDRKSKIDLMSEIGMKELEDAMYNSMKAKDKLIRGAVGGAITALAFILIKMTAADDEYEKWIKKNQWAKKYLNIFTPELMLYMLAAKSTGALRKYVESLFNQNEAFDKGKMALKTIYSEDKKTALGALLNSSIGNPIPWRLVRDGQQIWTGATGGEPYAINPVTPKSFGEGFLKGGMFDYLGLAPVSEDKSIIVSKKELESPEYKIYKDREIKMPKIGSIGSYNVPMDAAHPEKTMTPDEFSKFSDLVKSYELNGWEEVNENGKTETHYGLKEIPGVTWKVKEKGMITEEVATSALSNEELQNKVNQLHGDAVEKAKQDLGLAPIKKTRRRITSL